MMKVIDGHKGIASFRTKVTGYTTHSSQTDRGVSAVEAAARLISKITDMREQRASAADPKSSFHPPYTTMTVNVARGGTQLNIMAGECIFEWDCRAIPGESAKAVLAEFSAYAAGVEETMRRKAPSCRIDTTQISNAPPLKPESDNPAAELAKALTGRNSTDVVGYAAEAGQFQEAGFSTVICGPGSIDQAHQPNEFVALSQIAECTLFLRKLIARLAV
jgi:acetylornithine deacetylase